MNDLTMIAEMVARLANLDPYAAADRLDAVADILKSHAADMRRRAEFASLTAPSSPGGVGDSCKIRVAGPDGVVTQDRST